MRTEMAKEDTMNIDSIRRAIRFAGLVLPLTWAPGSMAGQMRAAQAQSFGVGVTTATVNQQAPSAVLPAGGTMAQDQASNVSIADMVTAQDAFAIVAGDGTDASDAVSSATLGQVSILNGLITADGIVAMASSTVDGGGANSNAEGSSLANLVVNGVQVSDPAPNTRMDLPGVGYVVVAAPGDRCVVGANVGPRTVQAPRTGSRGKAQTRREKFAPLQWATPNVYTVRER